MTYTPTYKDTLPTYDPDWKKLEGIVDKYGVDPETRQAFLDEFLPVLKAEQKKAKYPFLTAKQTRYYTPAQMREMGVLPPIPYQFSDTRSSGMPKEPFKEEDVTYELTPDETAEKGFRFAKIYQDNWKVTDENVFISPDGKQFTEEEYKAYWDEQEKAWYAKMDEVYRQAAADNEAAEAAYIAELRQATQSAIWRRQANMEIAEQMDQEDAFATGQETIRLANRQRLETALSTTFPWHTVEAIY